MTQAFEGPNDIERATRKRRAGEVGTLEPDLIGQAASSRDTARLVDLALRERDPHDLSANTFSEPKAASAQTASRIEHAIVRPDFPYSGESAIGIVKRLGMTLVLVVMEAEVERQVAAV